MANIAFWTHIHGQAGNTSNLIATALLTSMEYNLKTLVAHTQWSHSTLESSLLKENIFQNELITFSDTGIDALERLARASRLYPEIIKDYTNPIIKDRLDLLVGTTKKDESMYEKLKDVIQLILSTAKRHYDLLLLDVHSGSRNQLTNTVIGQADLIVVCLNQNVRVIEQFVNREFWPEAMENKRYIIVIGQYDPYSKYTIKNIRRKYKLDAPIFAVPYCTEFRDACNDQEVKSFFTRAKNANKIHDPYFFIQEVRRLVLGILEQVGIDSKMKIIQRGAS